MSHLRGELVLPKLAIFLSIYLFKKKKRARPFFNTIGPRIVMLLPCLTRVSGKSVIIILSLKDNISLSFCPKGQKKAFLGLFLTILAFFVVLALHGQQKLSLTMIKAQGIKF